MLTEVLIINHNCHPAFPMKKISGNELWLLFTLITFLLLSAWLTHFDAGITNKVSPDGILSFEFNTGQHTGEKMLDTWREQQTIHLVKYQTCWDFLFIITYTLLVCMLVYRSLGRPGKPASFFLKAGLLMALVAGCMDVIENIFILLAAYNKAHYLALGVSIPAFIKFGLLGILALAVLYHSLRFLSFSVSLVLRTIWTFRIVIIGLLFTLLILWGMDQGQDLLLSINSHRIGPAVSLLVITLFALANWYFPKYYDTNVRTTFTIHNVFFSSWDYEAPQHREKTFTGRLLGALSFMLPGACVLNAMQVFRIHYWLDFINPFMLLIILMILYYLILKYGWFCNRKLVALICVIVFCTVLAFGFQDNNDKPYFLAFFALDFFLLSFAFLLYTNIRKGLNQQIITPYIMFSLTAIAIFFLIANLNPTWFAFNSGYRFLTLPIVFCGIIFYIFVLSMLLILGLRYKIQFITFLLIAALVRSVASNNEYHSIRFIETKKDTVSTLPLYDSLHQYAQQWLAVRRPEISAYNNHYHRPYPVFIINAYGGGIRAAAWTSKIVHAIDTTLIAAALSGKDSSLNYDFQHYVFAYSGASGGTIGASVLCAERFHQLQQPQKTSADYAAFYKNDFLTPVLIPLLGRDIWLSFLGFKVPDDRAGIQERTWEIHASKQAQFDYGLPLRNYWYDKNPVLRYEIPLLFANTYDIDQGVKGITAPVLLSPLDFPVAFRMNDELEQYNKDTSFPDRRQLRLSTGAFLSARFPYISPEGKYNGQHHFLDGGLKENSGAETAAEIRRCLEMAAMSADGRKDSSIQFYMLSLPNAIKETDTIKKAKNVFELTAPFTALMNNWVGNTYKADSVNAMLQLKEGYIYQLIRPSEPVNKAAYMPVLPLGWQISDDALEYMDKSIRDPDNKWKIDALVRRIYEKNR
ncbi:hypothetical protein Cpin_4061 [Chitinophaga pinensis DSM 2588]|uniref:Patatin-like phospholipase n=2 Tax=Chitinophaga pinensis TaxID=79329 RepID=A0A979GW38_CHIPD|nr:hypothetical protein Cpin_4061 [Chitinophaga pinensis DSM 2588]